MTVKLTQTWHNNMEKQEQEEEEEEEEEEEKHTISSPPSPMDSSPPKRSHRERKPIPSPVDSPANSTVSSDRTSHGYFSPREDRHSVPPPETSPSITPAKPPSPVTVANRSVRDEPVVVTKVDPGAGAGVVEEGEISGGGGGGGWKPRLTFPIQRRRRREGMVKRVALGVRVCGLVFCMISFSVMVADKNQGWALDSFDRYKEFRYCLSVNIIGFIYSGVQASDLALNLTTGSNIVWNDLRCYFDFFIDQILSYLLISASSSAATRVEDWESNWGKDKFPQMSRASVALSFLAFVALASSSLISGYTLCMLKAT